jgi:DNA-binding GntR family transcriptional regulator
MPPHFHLFYQKSFRVTRSNLAQLESISTKGGKAAKHRRARKAFVFGSNLNRSYTRALVRPLSPAEASEIAEIKLALIGQALTPAHPHLASADLDLAYELAKRITRANRATEAFECNRHFWDLTFEKAHRPILLEVFTKLDYRMARYYPLMLELYPTPESRPRQLEALIELYREGEIAEALRAFKKIYLEVVDQLTDHLKSQESGDSCRRNR